MVACRPFKIAIPVSLTEGMKSMKILARQGPPLLMSDDAPLNTSWRSELQSFAAGRRLPWRVETCRSARRGPRCCFRPSLALKQIWHQKGNSEARNAVKLNPLMPNRYNCKYVLFLFLRSTLPQTNAQSWAISVILNLFNNKKLFVPYLIKLNWLGVSF